MPPTSVFFPSLCVFVYCWVFLRVSVCFCAFLCVSVCFCLFPCVSVCFCVYSPGFRLYFVCDLSVLSCVSCVFRVCFLRVLVCFLFVLCVCVLCVFSWFSCLFSLCFLVHFVCFLCVACVFSLWFRLLSLNYWQLSLWIRLPFPVVTVPHGPAVA